MPNSTLKALCYFHDGDLASIPQEAKDRLVRAVAAVDLSRLPASSRCADGYPKDRKIADEAAAAH